MRGGAKTGLVNQATATEHNAAAAIANRSQTKCAALFYTAASGYTIQLAAAKDVHDDLDKAEAARSARVSQSVRSKRECQARKRTGHQTRLCRGGCALVGILAHTGQ